MASKRIETLASQGRSVDVINPNRTTVDPRKDTGISARRVAAVQPAREREPSVTELAIAVWQRAAVQVVLHSKGPDFDENAERIASRAVDVARYLHQVLLAPQDPKEEEAPSEPEPKPATNGRNAKEHKDPFNERGTPPSDEPKPYAERVEPESEADEGSEAP